MLSLGDMPQIEQINVAAESSDEGAQVDVEEDDPLYKLRN